MTEKEYDSQGLNEIFEREILTEEALFEVYGPNVFVPDQKYKGLDNFQLEGEDLEHIEKPWDISFRQIGKVVTESGFTLPAYRARVAKVDPETVKQLRTLKADIDQKLDTLVVMGSVKSRQGNEYGNLGLDLANAVTEYLRMMMDSLYVHNVRYMVRYKIIEDKKSDSTTK